MRKVFQETLTGCFRACVASIFNRDFCDVPECFERDTWNWEKCQVWLSSETNTQAIVIEQRQRSKENALQFGYVVGETPLMILGYTHPDEIAKPGHAVVGCIRNKDIVIVHDPCRNSIARYGCLARVTMFVNLKQSAT